MHNRTPTRTCTAKQVQATNKISEQAYSEYIKFTAAKATHHSPIPITYLQWPITNDHQRAPQLFLHLAPWLHSTNSRLFLRKKNCSFSTWTAHYSIRLAIWPLPWTMQWRSSSSARIATTMCEPSSGTVQWTWFAGQSPQISLTWRKSVTSMKSLPC